MALERAHYESRPQALVKHTFLHHYLPALVNKVGTVNDCFIYIDGFAGPWQAADEENFEDTSFGIALRAMHDAQVFQEKRGRNVKMVAHLVEKDGAAFSKLQCLKARYPTIEIIPYHGSFESHFSAIRSAVNVPGFCFAFIDPKGVSLDLQLLKPLLARSNSEVLINFMFDFVNRFIEHPNTAIVDTMNRLIPGTDWRNRLDVAKAAGLAAKERERIIVDAFRSGLAAEGNYKFVPSLTVQKAVSDRTLYHLVFGTRHPEGLSVFRDSENKALTAQAEVRTAKKIEQQTNKSGQGLLFGSEELVPFDPSSLAIEDGRKRGIELALEKIRASGNGIRWDDLWPSVLAQYAITRKELGAALNNARKEKLVGAPNWPSDRHSKPSADQLFIDCT